MLCSSFKAPKVPENRMTASPSPQTLIVAVPAGWGGAQQ
jgi:hypothetical protein